MNNYENQKERIDAILDSNNNIAVDRETNKATTCNSLACSKCLFSTQTYDCYRGVIRWLLSEYKEPEPEVDWSKVPVDTPELVSNDEKFWYNRYFAGVDDDGRLFIFQNGRTSWSNKGYDRIVMPYEYIKLAEVK